MRVNLNPREWTDLDTIALAEHVDWCMENSSWPRFNLFLTDDGWAVECTIRTAGAASSVSGTFMLPQAASDALDEAYEEAEQMIIFDGGLGVQVEL